MIGSGPGGYVAAIRAAQLGLKTAVVEKGNIGGRCLNEACIPAKAMLRVAEVFHETQHAGDFGIKVEGASVDYPGATKHRDKVIKTLTSGVAMLFEKNKIDFIEGFGSVTDDANVKIGGQFDGTEIETDRVILAVGSVPKPILDLQFGKRILDTAGDVAAERAAEEAVRDRRAARPAPRSPRRSAGSAPRSRCSRRSTRSCRSRTPRSPRPSRARSRSRTCASRPARRSRAPTASDPGVKVTFNDESDEFDYLVIAAGRAPDVEGLGLEEAGIERDDRGLIKVDGRLRTSLKGVWAIGDMVPGPALAHKASDEGIIAVEDAAGHGRPPDRLRASSRP